MSHVTITTNNDTYHVSSEFRRLAMITGAAATSALYTTNPFSLPHQFTFQWPMPLAHSLSQAAFAGRHPKNIRSSQIAVTWTELEDFGAKKAAIYLKRQRPKGSIDSLVLMVDVMLQFAAWIAPCHS